jgi:hypothetical protein
MPYDYTTTLITTPGVIMVPSSLISAMISPAGAVVALLPLAVEQAWSQPSQMRLESRSSSH